MLLLACESTDFSRDCRREVLRYFRASESVGPKKYALFSNDDIEWLNDANSRFHGDRFDALYTAWCSGKLSRR